MDHYFCSMVYYYLSALLLVIVVNVLPTMTPLSNITHVDHLLVRALAP